LEHRHTAEETVRRHYERRSQLTLAAPRLLV
jgi:hypothetical protein